MVVASAAGDRRPLHRRGRQVAAAEAINASPALVALYGPILDVHSLGELAMTKMTVLYAVFVAFMAVVVVRRHTRVEEETGRAELRRRHRRRRRRPGGAALVEATPGSPSRSGCWPRSATSSAGCRSPGRVLFGASWAGIGLVGAGVVLLAAQVSSSARTVGFVAAAVIGALYLAARRGGHVGASG